MMVDYLNPVSFLVLVNTCKCSFFCAHPQFYLQQKEKVQTDTGFCAQESIAGLSPEFSRHIDHTSKLCFTVTRLDMDFGLKQISNRVLGRFGFWDRAKTPSTARVTKEKWQKPLTLLLSKSGEILGLFVISAVQKKSLCAQKQLLLPF